MSPPARRVIFVNRVTWPSTAATAQLLTDLAEGLAAQGWDVHVIAAGEASTRQNGVTIHRTGGHDRHDGLVSRLVNDGRFRRAAQHQLVTLVQPGDVVVAMTDPPMLGATLAGVVARRGAKLVHWAQDIYPEILSAHLGAWAHLPLLPLRARRDAAWRDAAACLTLGADMQQTLLDRGVPAERALILPNWAPRELAQPAPPAAIAARRAAWGVADKFVVAYSGNLGRVHEFDAVIDAATRLRDRSDIAFVFIGTGARFEEVRTAVTAHRLVNVRLLPPEPRETLAASLAAADAHLVTLKPAFACLVYPSKLAGVLAAGRPALFVGPPGGDIARLLAQEQCGASFHPAGGEKLATTITLWRSNPTLCRELGHRARLAYEKNFSFADLLGRWESTLRSVSACR